MLLLTSPTDKLQVITDAAVTVDVHASWVDNAAGTITPGRTNTNISTATTSDVVGSPAASTQRNVQTLVIRNRSALTPVGIMVQHTDGTIVSELFSLTLPAQYELQYLDGVGFTVFDNFGRSLSFGVAGAAGAAGADGAAGGQGAPSMVPGEDGETPTPMFVIPGRAGLPGDAKNWAFLGTIAGTGVTVGPLVFPSGDWQHIYGEYIIGGYNGGTPVGRLLCGAASISTTALTNGTVLRENTNAVNVTALSKPGVPLAVTLSAIARSGFFYIKGASGALKQISAYGMEGNPAVATAPVQFEAQSFFSDLGTNLLIKRLQLTVYDTLITTTPSAQTFIATTQLWAWGRMND